MQNALDHPILGHSGRGLWSESLRRFESQRTNEPEQTAHFSESEPTLMRSLWLRCDRLLEEFHGPNKVSLANRFSTCSCTQSSNIPPKWIPINELTELAAPKCCGCRCLLLTRLLLGNRSPSTDSQRNVHGQWGHKKSWGLSPDSL